MEGLKGLAAPILGGSGGQDMEESDTSTLRALFVVFVHINGRQGPKGSSAQRMN